MQISRADRFIASLGFEAYRVGGSVRDEVMARAPKDGDYVVRASLWSLRRALGYAGVRSSELTLRNGTHVGYRAYLGGHPVEIVLPRTERSTADGHGDFEIVVDPALPLAEDAKRRDFTFNALYRDLNHCDKPILDPLGHGLEDIRRRRVNVTHADSFRDDPLRILRALRFVSTLGFELAPAAYALMTQHAGRVTGLTKRGVSGTVAEELSRILMGRWVANALRLARDTGVLPVVLPELAPMIGHDQQSRYHDDTTDEHTFKALDLAASVGAPLVVRWALLFHDAGKPEAAWRGKDGKMHYYATEDTEDHEVISERLWLDAAARLGIGRQMRQDVACLVRNHMVPAAKFKSVRVRRDRVRLGDGLLSALYMMRMCDLGGKEKRNIEQLRVLAQMEEERRRCVRWGVPASVEDLQINGHDLIEMGVKGPKVGEVLRKVLDEVVCDNSPATDHRDWQVDAAKRLARSS